MVSQDLHRPELGIGCYKDASVLVGVRGGGGVGGGVLVVAVEWEAAGKL